MSEKGVEQRAGTKTGDGIGAARGEELAFACQRGRVRFAVLRERLERARRLVGGDADDEALGRALVFSATTEQATQRRGCGRPRRRTGVLARGGVALHGSLLLLAHTADGWQQIKRVVSAFYRA